MFAANPFRDGTRVYLTNPAGRRVGFTFAPEPEGGVLGTIWHPRFLPDPGVYDQLTVADTPLSQRDDGTYTHYLVNLPYNPSEYQLTTKDGLTYRYDQFTGLQDITDRNQNVLTYTADGITSSTGVAIQFHRDAQGRITEITDPAGNAIRYTYDAAGDLATVTNQTGDVTTYYYRADPPHYFDHYVCPLCVPMVRTEYDQAGRVVGTYDVLGNPVTQTYDLANNTEIVADRLGNETTLDVRRSRQHRFRNERLAGPHRRLPIRCPRQSRCRRQRPRLRDPLRYDERGNVTGSTDALGNDVLGDLQPVRPDRHGDRPVGPYRRLPLRCQRQSDRSGERGGQPQLPGPRCPRPDRQHDGQPRQHDDLCLRRKQPAERGDESGRFDAAVPVQHVRAGDPICERDRRGDELPVRRLGQGPFRDGSGGRSHAVRVRRRRSW